MTQTAAVGYKPTRADKRSFWMIMLPALVEGFVTQLFGMVDTAMLGNTADSAVNISAVSFANSVIAFVIAVSSAFMIGTTAAVSFYFGQGAKDKVGATSRQSFLAMLLAGFGMAIVGVIFAPQLVKLAGARDEMLSGATLYFRIVMLGFPFEAMTYAITASLRGIGITQISMIYNLTAGAFNVLGNYLLIYGKFGFPELGVAGAAASTAISKLVAFVIAVWYIFSKDTLVRLRLRDDYRFTRDGIGRVCSVGITTAMEQAILQGGNIIATKIISALDTTSIAAVNVCGSIGGITWRAGGACQVVSTSFTGRDLGEGRPDKARARALMVYRYSMYFSVGMSVFMILFRNPLARIYSPEVAVWTLAGEALITEAFSIFGTTTHQVLAGSLRSAGDSKYALIASLISLWTMRVMVQFLLMHFGLLTVLTARLCIMLDQWIRGTIVALRFFTSDKFKVRPGTPAVEATTDER